MKQLCPIVWCAIMLILSNKISAGSDSLYSRAWGNRNNEAILFLHGGPGYNSIGFELSTAQRLAEAGYYVICYDRRGEGRSTYTDAQYTFAQTNDDIAAILQKYRVDRAHLMGHSFGGIVATRFAQANPKLVKSIILVGAPVSLQKSFRTVQRSCRVIYELVKDSLNLQYLSVLEKMDTTSLAYSSYTFMQAMHNGFYSPDEPTAEAQAIQAEMKKDSVSMQLAKKMTFEGPQGFWKNERYTTIDLTNDLINLRKNGLPLYALYGKEDGLYSSNQIDELMSIIGDESKLEYFSQCSHNVFIDQQKGFIQAIQTWINPKTK